MPTVIKTIFDDLDSAESAVIGLKQREKKVRAHKVTRTESNEKRSGLDTFAGFPGLAAPMMINTIPMGMGIAPVLPMGIVYDRGYDPEEGESRDVINNEALLEITVDDEDAKDVEAELISMGARRVT